MTGYKMITIALGLLKYPSFEELNIDTDHANAILNAVYSDLFYMNNESGFKHLNSSNEEIKLNERVLNDVMPYGVAMHLAESQNDGDNQQLFAVKYNQKRLSLSRKSIIKDSLPIPD